MLRTALASLAVALSLVPAVAQQPLRDIPGGRDHPLVGRYEGSVLRMVQDKQYEEQRLVVRAITDEDLRAAGNVYRNPSNSIEVAGRTLRMRYEGPVGRSALEVGRNFQDRLTRSGAEILFQCRGRSCGGIGSNLWFAVADASPMNPRDGHGIVSNWATAFYIAARFARPEGDVFVTIYTVERGEGANTTPLTLVDVVETRPMETNRIVFVDAAQMASSIQQTGRVALYGIHFDFDRADLRAESAPTLNEIARLMNANPAVSVVVVGHTDARGGFDYNVELSRRRAMAVVASLVRDYGIAPQRLTPFGAGMGSPVASNASDEGRALNRRVELVLR